MSVQTGSPGYAEATAAYKEAREVLMLARKALEAAEIVHDRAVRRVTEEYNKMAAGQG